MAPAAASEPAGEQCESLRWYGAPGPAQASNTLTPSTYPWWVLRGGTRWDSCVASLMHARQHEGRCNTGIDTGVRGHTGVFRTTRKGNWALLTIGHPMSLPRPPELPDGGQQIYPFIGSAELGHRWNGQFTSVALLAVLKAARRRPRRGQFHLRGLAGWCVILEIA